MIYVQADVLVKVNSIMGEGKEFVVDKAAGKVGKMKGVTSVSDDNKVFNLMRQLCNEWSYQRYIV